ncbi:MAG TPA: SAM-dependent methyltransferase [Streptosporangiaceae bacterium]|nr:SAM-dependent methyltransferase [Streptosporangiaceae bacterium]
MSGRVDHLSICQSWLGHCDNRRIGALTMADGARWRGQMSTEPDDVALDDPFEIDTTVAHAARRYNYWLGGEDHFEADRISGDAWVAMYPTVKLAAQENRRFLERAVTFLVEEAGIRQFLDIGTGIPSANTVHEVAQAIAPESRVVYVDNDPIVLAHARRLLSTNTPTGATAYIHADVREPAAILGHPDLRATLDLSRPVALMLVAVMHFVEDADDPYGCVATLTDALAPGSYLAMSHGTTELLPAEQRVKFEQWVEQEERSRNRDALRPRTEAEFARFFEGMELVPPGIVPLPDWRGELPPADRLAAADASAYCALARIS